MDKVRQLRAEARTVARGERPRDRLRIAGMLLHSHLREGRARYLLGWLPEGRGDPRELRLRSGTELLGRRGDGTVLFEQFGLDVYRVEAPPPVRTVVDIGANVGFATLRLAEHFPGARFVCVEPTPASRGLLSANLQRNAVDAQVFAVAVVGEPGRFAVQAGGHFGANTVTPRGDGDVEGITLSTLLDRAGVAEVDLLKLDIEGGERAVFETVESWAGRVRTVIVELHDGLEADAVVRRLRPVGYERLALAPGLGREDLVCLTRARGSALEEHVGL